MVRGLGADLTACDTHPDTHAPLVGTVLPDWTKRRMLATEAASVCPGIRSQSWDIALSDQGPVCLVLNYGGDLNLAQLAEGRGVLDQTYRDHLSECGYHSNRKIRSRRSQSTPAGCRNGYAKLRWAATARAKRAAAGAAARPPPMSAPLPPAGFAVVGLRKDQIEGQLGSRLRRRSPKNPENRAMTDDTELDLFRAWVNCAAILENMGRPWRLDKAGSTKRAMKYRRAQGEIVIVTHDGRGWWDPNSGAKGDVFTLVQHLDPSLNFSHVRQVLRRFVGVTPRYEPEERRRKGQGADRPVAERWAGRARLRTGCPAWRYLCEQRHLPAEILFAAGEQDIIRDGAYGSASRSGQGDACRNSRTGLAKGNGTSG